MRIGKRAKAMTAAGALALAAAGGVAATPAATASQSADCRTYSSVTVCGEITLNSAQSACVAHAVGLGMTERRAEVECTHF